MLQKNSNKSRRYIYGYGIKKRGKTYVRGHAHGYGILTDISNFVEKFAEAKNLARDVGQAAVDVYNIGKNTRDIVKKLTEKSIEDELIEKLKIGAGIEIV